MVTILTLMKVKSCNVLLYILMICILIYLKSFLRYKFLFWITHIQTLYLGSFTRNSSVAQNLAYESQWNKVNSIYSYLKKSVSPSVQLNNKHLAQPHNVKYLGIHLDRKLTWRKHITTKRKQLDLKLRKLYWITSRKSQLSQENKLLVYKAVLKPIWTYGYNCGDQHLTLISTSWKDISPKC